MPTINPGGPTLINAVEFTPSPYDWQLTMNGAAQGGPLPSNAIRVSILNRGASTEHIRIAFGKTQAEADANLTIATGAATTGYLIPAAVSTADQTGNREIIGIYPGSRYFSVANAAAGDTQTVNINFQVK